MLGFGLHFVNGVPLCTMWLSSGMGLTSLGGKGDLTYTLHAV